MPHKDRLTFSGVFRWIDTPWTVAVALGVWGVMIGIEDFVVADIAIILGALFALMRLAKETLMWTRQRHGLAFAVGLTVIVVLVVFDLAWTESQRVAAEGKKVQLAQLGQIPELRETIRTMTRNEQETAKAPSHRASKA